MRATLRRTRRAALRASGGGCCDAQALWHAAPNFHRPVTAELPAASLRIDSLPRVVSETYVHVACSRSAQVATYADPQQPVQSSDEWTVDGSQRPLAPTKSARHMTRRPPRRAPCLARHYQVTMRASFQRVGPGKPGSQLPVGD